MATTLGVPLRGVLAGKVGHRADGFEGKGREALRVEVVGVELG